jgi:hypothetical protein
LHKRLLSGSKMKRWMIALILVCGCVKPAPPLPLPKITPDTFIEITMTGGGIYGGINPTIENKKVINNNGEVLLSSQALYTGSQKYSKNISRAQVEELAKFIAGRGFFSMKDVYDCRRGDKNCELRKTGYPPAVPLTISVTIGNLKKSITVTVFEKGAADFPENLEAIVNKINEAVNQAQQP